jgi:hypothetical protein
MSLAPARSARGFGVALTAVTVALTLTTAYIHLSLGGVLFTLNALGYAALAVALAIGAIPHPLIARFSWLPRVGLAGFTAVTIVAYLVIGPYFGLGWIAKAVEVGILLLVAVDVVRVYGSPAGLVRAAMGTLRELRAGRPMRSPTA